MVSMRYRMISKRYRMSIQTVLKIHCVAFWVVLWAGLSLVCIFGNSGLAGDYKVATFVVDVTPPKDAHPLIWLIPVKEVETPLLAKGIVLDAGSSRYVLCALDWCGLANDSHHLFVDKIAKAARTRPENVAVHCVHQHTAPYTDGDAQRILSEVGFEPLYVDHKFMEEVTDRVAAAVDETLENLQPVNQVGFAAVKVEEVASNRRVKTPEGKILVRYSACRDPALRAMPEGLIDPYVRTVTLAQDGKPVVRLHYYATHPQSFYGDPRASYDVPGFAREQLQKEERICQIYFTGCAGNITMGKYNDGSREARDQLTERLLQAMREATRSTQWQPLRQLSWKVEEAFLPMRNDPGYTPEEMEARVKNPTEDPVQRVRAACWLACYRRADRPFLLQALFLNEVVLLHLPGESFVEFQLYAQSLRPEKFVAVAAYGDLAPGYICTEVAYSEGGYEPTASALAPHAETVFKQAIRRLLEP